MEQWAGKVALVTGASVGIGAEISRALAKNGLKVIPIARRLDKLEELTASIKREFKADVYPMSCDVQKEEDILKVFKWADAELGGIDVLINNAGVLKPYRITEDTTENYRNIIDVNVIAMAICTREFVQSIKKRGKPGYIINMNSITGHFPEALSIPVSLYPTSKYAITGMTQSLRTELVAAKLDIKLTSISPGLVDTDMPTAANIPNEVLETTPMLQSADVADAVIYCLSTPKRAQVAELILIPHNSLVRPL